MLGRSDLKDRTKDIALTIIRLFSTLDKKIEAQIIGRQLLRSATSVGAHYREAQRAKSNADFISKIEGALQELEESYYWLELLRESGLTKSDHVSTVMKETDELTAIFVSIANKAKTRERNRNR